MLLRDHSASAKPSVLNTFPCRQTLSHSFTADQYKDPMLETPSIDAR